MIPFISSSLYPYWVGNYYILFYCWINVRFHVWFYRSVLRGSRRLVFEPSQEASRLTIDFKKPWKIYWENCQGLKKIWCQLNNNAIQILLNNFMCQPAVVYTALFEDKGEKGNLNVWKYIKTLHLFTLTTHKGVVLCVIGPNLYAQGRVPE